jgi:hypothetical protein
MADTDERPPPLTEEGQLNRLIALAYRQAEHELANMTATSQVVTTFLELGTAKAKVELEEKRLRNELLQAKIKTEHSMHDLESGVDKVLDALRTYSLTRYDDEY